MANVIRELVIKVTVDADTKGLDDTAKSEEKAKVGAQALGTALGSLAADLVKVGLQAAKAGAAFVADLVFGTSEAADATAKMSKQLNVNVEQLQRLRGAAALSGADTKTLDKGVRLLTKGLADAAQKGTGPAAEGLAALGIQVEEIDSLLVTGDIEGALGLIGDRFNETGESAQKNAALLKIFGGAGSQLRPLIEEGTEGIKGLGDEIRNVISEEDLQKFEDLEDAQFLLKDSVQAVKNEVAIALAPAIEDIAGKARDWIDENETFISQDLPGIMTEVGETLVSTGEFLFDLLTSWREFIRDTKDLAELLSESLGPALDDVSDSMAGLENFAAGVGLALLDMTEAFLEAIGAGDQLLQVLKEIRKEVLGDNGPQGTRGAAAVQHATAEGVLIGEPGQNVGESEFTAASASGDPTRLRELAAQEKFSDSQRARFTAAADEIDLDNAAKAEKASAEKASKRRADIEASRNRTRSARRSSNRNLGRFGGGKSGGKPAAEEASVDDLIAGAIGTATGAGPAKVGSSALAGTMLINVDQSVNVTNGPVTIALEVPASVLESGTPEDLAEFVRSEFEDLRNQERRVTFDFFQARRAVGAG
jgi:hypothetical protein